jgi:hypothetical protein
VAEAVISEMSGTVEVQRKGEDEFKPAAKETKLYDGDTVRSGQDGEATIAFWDHSVADLTPESAVVIDAGRTLVNPSAAVTVMAGAAQLEVAKRAEGQPPFSVYTPSTVTAVQGTILSVGVGLSGDSRVAVDEGTVEVVPVAKLDAEPVVVEAGKQVEVAAGQDRPKLRGYDPEKADWDEWLEKHEAQAAKKADQLAKRHKELIERLAKKYEELEKKEKELEKLAAELAEKAEKAKEAEKVDDYEEVQPNLAVNIEKVDVLREHERILRARLASHGYLLGLLHGRVAAGVYKLPPPKVKVIETQWAAAGRVVPDYRARMLRRRARRRRLRRLRRAYYIHHPRGREVAVAVGVEVPKFYLKVKPRRRKRLRRRISIKGWRGPLYRRPRYRGKRRKLRRRVRRGRKARLVRRRQRRWYAAKKWRHRNEKLRARRIKRRKRWRKRVVQRRRKRWKKRPKVKVRTWRRRRRRVRGKGPGIGKGRRPVHPGKGRGIGRRRKLGKGVRGVKVKEVKGPMRRRRRRRVGKGPANRGVRLRKKGKGVRIRKKGKGVRIRKKGKGVRRRGRRGMGARRRMRRKSRRRGRPAGPH